MIGWITRSRPAESVKEFVQDEAAMAFGSIPMFGQFVSSAVMGFRDSQGLVTTQAMERLQEAAYYASKGEWDKVLGEMPELVGYAVGVPVGGPKRFLQGFWDLASGKSSDWLRLMYSEYARNKAKGETSTTTPTKTRPVWER